MSIDPVDDCTFWYTDEYLTKTGDTLGNTKCEFQVQQLPLS
jgi:hypothetical protein